METHRQTSGKTLSSNTQKRSVKWFYLPFIALLRLYRYCLSPLLGPRCRFEPSCSVYSEQAITEYGVSKGLYLSARRLCKCHPWHHGGYDPVLPKNQKTSSHK